MQAKMNGKRKSSQKSAPKPKKAEVTAEEKAIEEFLFGKDILVGKSHWEEAENAVQFSIDTAPAKVEADDAGKAVWQDEDDEEVMVNLDNTSRLKRLKYSKAASGASVVTGTELSTLLRERFQPVVQDWTTRAIHHADHNDLLDDEDYEVLQQSEGLLGFKAMDSSVPLPAERIRMQRVLDANHAEPATKSITAMNFHWSGQRMAIASADKSLSLFQIDHETNKKLVNIKFKDMAVRSARFLKNKEELLVSGRKPYFYSYQTETGQLMKYPGPQSAAPLNNLQHLATSPEGSLFGVVGVAGYVHLGESSSKQFTMTLKMNSPVTSMGFLGENMVVTSAMDASVFLWDVRNSSKAVQCVGRFEHDDGTPSTSLATYTPTDSAGKYSLDSSYFALGTASGVVSVFQSSHSDVKTGSYFPLQRSTRASDLIGRGFVQKRTVMNLTTKISSCAFHPSGQVLAMASYMNKDQLRLLHLPSNTIFCNWPMQQTPLHHIECVEFSPTGDTLAVGNQRGRVLLFQMPHFLDPNHRRELRKKRRMN